MATNGASRPNSAQPLRPSECSGQPLTMSMIERALHRLRAQRPSCRCGLCEAAAKSVCRPRLPCCHDVAARSVARDPGHG